MSHELRTPLNAVLGFSQLLQSDSKSPLTSSQHAQVEHIRMAGWHLLTLINDVLDVSKIEAGRVDIEERGVDLMALLDESVRINDGSAAQRGINIIPTYRSLGRLFVRADPARLRQVMINLLSNAIKYNRDGGRVDVSVSIETDEIHITVADTGMGMNHEQLQHLFEPFNRLGREHHGIEGTGLGLALTRQLVLLMHGRIEVNSEEGVGTCVRVAMPLHEPIHQLEAATLPVHSETSDVEGLPAGVVLYIEDNPVNVLLIEQLLLRWPDVVLLQAETGRDGIALAQTAQPNLILLDMQLPDMNGLEVLAELGRQDNTRGLPVVALSASAMPDEISAARETGALDYWTKPLDFEYFLREMRRLLEKV
jgi:CheY-like chemotaxis protein/anti-sigma regulatory factor (Ser/Thr protein kinase)